MPVEHKRKPAIEPRKPQDLSETATKAYHRLRTVGLPSDITLESFSALYSSGKWKEALDVLSTQLVGRQAVNEYHNSSRSADLDTVKKNRDSAYRVLGAVKREWEVESVKVRNLEERIKLLKSGSDQKSRALLLLRVLEKKEVARLARLASGQANDKGKGKAKEPYISDVDTTPGIGDLITNLRIQSKEAQKLLNIVLQSIDTFPKPPTIPPSSSSSSSILSASLKKSQRNAYQHTTTALANLHAHHQRLLRPLPTQAQLEADLAEALQKAGVPEADLERVKRRFIAQAQARATSETPSTDADPLRDLETLKHSNTSRAHDIQEKLNRGVALGWICEGYIDIISTFRTESAPALLAMLEDESRRVEGWVEDSAARCLSSSSSSSSSPTQPQPAFANQVREALRITHIDLSSEVDRLIRQLRLVDMEGLKIPSDITLSTTTTTTTTAEESERIIAHVSARAESTLRTALAAADDSEKRNETRVVLDGMKKLKYI